MVNEFDILAWGKRKVFILDGDIIGIPFVFFQDLHRPAQFRHISIEGQVCTLPRIINAFYLLNLCIGQNGLFLLFALVDDNFFNVLIPPAQIHKENLSTAVTNLSAIYRTGILVHVHDP